MVRFGRIVLMYFVMGAVMFGGGAVQYDDAGLVQWFVDKDKAGVSADERTSAKLNNKSGAIQNVIQQFSGPLILVWDLVVGLMAFIHWPVTVLVTNNAPPRMILTLGGPVQVGFYISTVKLIRSSA